MATATVAPRGHVARPTRSAAAAGRDAFTALLLRDLRVLRKNLKEFLPRTLLQPLLLAFVFLYVFPTIGQGIGGGQGLAGQSRFATILVAGVVGLSIMFQGIQAVALPMVQEFGYTKEIEDRVLAPLPVSFVAVAKVVSGAAQSLFAALLVFPIAALVHAHQIHLHLSVHWLVLVTVIPLACVTCSAMSTSRTRRARGAPSTGSLDLASLIRALSEVEYGGFVGLEYRAGASTTESLALARTKAPVD